MSVTVRPIESKTDVMKFIKSQWNFYKGDPNFVPPLIMDREKLLNKQKNPFYQHAEMQLFLAEENGTVVGRIAAIINHNHNKTHNDKIGFFGFFECVNNQQVANQLFDVACAWLRERGMTDVRGPMNPSINDECSFLVDGFTSPPVMLMAYNPPYYAALAEGYGFHKEMDMYAYYLRQENFRSEKMQRLVGMLEQRSKVKIRQMDFKNKAQFNRDVAALKKIYDEAWEHNWGSIRFTEAEFDFLANDLKQIAEPALALIAEIDGEVIGFGLALPDINQCLIHNKNGGILGGVWHLLTKKKKINLCRIIALGVLPEHRKSGIETILYNYIGTNAQKLNNMNGEASWILETNDMMNRGLQQTMHGERYKTYRIYQKPL